MTAEYVPPAAPPPRSRPRAAPLPLELAAAGIGLVAFILAFLPWLGLDCSGVPVEDRGDCESVHYSGWQLPAGTAGTVLLVVAALLLVHRLIDLTPPAVSSLPALLGLLGAVLVVVQFVIGEPFLNAFAVGTPAELSRRVSAILVLVVAIAEALVLVLAWLQASGRIAWPTATAARTGLAPGPGQPWQQPQQPQAPPGQGWGQPAPPQQPQDYPQSQDYPQPPGYGQPGGYGQPTPPGPPAGGYPPSRPGGAGPADSRPADPRLADPRPYGPPQPGEPGERGSPPYP